jgi:hypothetical protein
MPRSKTVARNRPFPAENPEWPRARKAQLRRTVLQRMAKLMEGGDPPAPGEETSGWRRKRSRGGPASREDACEVAANTPSMPR